ncbi:MAG: hypothetical protein U1D30_19785 [Planctomycetota bacterium]
MSNRSEDRAKSDGSLVGGIMERIFIEFQHLNGTTWFYLSLLLMIAIYFRFTRFFSLRNLDLIALFLLVPGLLAVHLHEQAPSASTVLPDGEPVRGETETEAEEAFSPVHLGYIWLFSVSGFFLARAFLDLFLARRPRLEPNLNISGLAFLAVALLGFLIYEVMVKRPDPYSMHGAKVASALWNGDQPATNIDAADPATVLMMGPIIAVHGKVADRVQEDTEITKTDVEQSVARSVAILCHLLIVSALLLIGWRHFDSPLSGMGLAALYLMLPVTAIHVEKIGHLLPSALILWAVYAYRRPWLSGMLLGVASVFLFPLFLIPLWTGFYWNRGARWFLATFFTVVIAFVFAIWWVPALRSFMEMQVNSLAWKAWEFQQMGETAGIWTKATQFYRFPIFVVFITLVIASAFWPKEKNLAELIALSVAILIGVQFWYNNRGGTYILWYLPLLLLMIYRPSLADARPPEPKLKTA